MNDAFIDSITGNSADSSTFTVVDSCNSSISGSEPQFSGNISRRSLSDSQFSGSELCVPYDDLAELEWLSSFVEESFSSDDLHNLQLISPTNIAPTDTSSSDTTPEFRSEPAPPRNNSPIFQTDILVPGKARSKRSRTAPCDWSSRLLLLSPAKSSSNTDNKEFKTTSLKKKEGNETSGRKCLHCGSDKTPQWRTGPLGPKTLCNACGVRFKSGRLVPEYRPAASPTFVSAKHSNSHRKVMELRRQKELHKGQQHQFVSQRSIFGVSNGEDYLIHCQSGSDYTQII